jgi:hypothetical protein
MKLEGLTNNNEHKLNQALLQLARKQKIDTETFWKKAVELYPPMKESPSLDSMPVNIRVDWLITLGYNLYKR